LAIRFDDTTLILLRPVAVLPEMPEAPQPVEAGVAGATVADPGGDAATGEPIVEVSNLASTASCVVQEEAVPAEAGSVVCATEDSPIDAVGGEPQGFPGQLHSNGEGSAKPESAESLPTQCVAADSDERIAVQDPGVEEHPSRDA